MILFTVAIHRYKYTIIIGTGSVNIYTNYIIYSILYRVGGKEGRKVEVYEAAMEWDSVENDTAVYTE